jgi:hypothetical protein
MRVSSPVLKVIQWLPSSSLLVFFHLSLYLAEDLSAPLRENEGKTALLIL